MAGILVGSCQTWSSLAQADIDYSKIYTSWEAASYCKETSYNQLSNDGYKLKQWHAESYVFGNTLETKGNWKTESDSVAVNCTVKQGSKAKSQRMKLLIAQ